MNQLRINIASDINRAHERASTFADEAVAQAITAGKLLIEVKAALPHGDFTAWLEENIFVSPRQVRRYMQVAQGRPLPIRSLAASPSKTDTVTDSKDWMPRPAFIPVAGHWCWCSVDGAMAYVVEPSLAHPGFFFISHLHRRADTYDCTRRPIRADFVETWLQGEGLPDPANSEWHIRPSDGVLQALEMLQSEGVPA